MAPCLLRESFGDLKLEWIEVEFNEWREAGVGKEHTSSETLSGGKKGVGGREHTSSETLNGGKWGGGGGEHTSLEKGHSRQGKGSQGGPHRTGGLRHDMQSERREIRARKSWGTVELKGHVNSSCEPPPPTTTATVRITMVPQWTSCLVLGEQK